MGEEEGFGALGIEVDLDFVVFRDLIAIDTKDCTKAKDAMGDAIVLLPGGRNWRLGIGDWRMFLGSNPNSWSFRSTLNIRNTLIFHFKEPLIDIVEEAGLAVE